MKPFNPDRRLKCTVCLSNYKQHEGRLFKDICVLFDQGEVFNFVSLTPCVLHRCVSLSNAQIGSLSETLRTNSDTNISGRNLSNQSRGQEKNCCIKINKGQN